MVSAQSYCILNVMKIHLVESRSTEHFIKCTHLFQVHLNALAMQLILAFMLCVVWSGTRKMIHFMISGYEALVVKKPI
jgi:hypothetical protein